MEGWIITGIVVLFALQAAQFRVMNRWIKCQGAHIRDDDLPITTKLIEVWRREIKKHDKSSAVYESYRKCLVKAGLTQYGD